MNFLVLLSMLLLLGSTEAQVGLLFSSNWSGTVNNINPVVSFLFSNYPCMNGTTNQGIFNLFFPAPGLSYLTPLGAMTSENTRLSGSNIKYVIGESNNILSFVFPTNPSSMSTVTPMYPSDYQIVTLMVSIVNSLFNPNLPKQGIMVVLKKPNDVNNLNIGNYKNIINQINQLNWLNVKFVDYQSAENVIYQLRLNPFYNILTFLSDPSDNRDLIQKAFKANLMVWQYRWVIMNLLGELNPLSDQTQFGVGVTTNNVSVITFADPITGKTGQTALIEDSLRLVRFDNCDNNKQVSFAGITGTINSIAGQLTRSNYKFTLYQNPGVNITVMSSITIDSTTNSVSFSPTITYVPFTMNVNTSTSSSRITGLRIGFVEYRPYSYKNGSAYQGFVMDALVQIATQMNMSYTIVDLSAQYTGLNAGTRNDSSLIYSQLLGLVQNNVVDTLSFLFVINNDMQKYFDFSSPVFPGYISVLYKNRTLTGINALLQYTMPFTWQVWVTFFGSALAVAFALTISDYVKQDKYARYGLLMSLFFSFSSLTHGAYFDPPRRIGGRIIMSFWWFFCLVVVIIWACNYAAFLAQTRSSQQLTDVFSLLNQKALAYGTLNDTLFLNFLISNNQSDAGSMYQIISEDQPNGTVADFSGAVSLVVNQNYAFIYVDRVITYLKNTNCLDMFGNWMGFEYGFVLPKNSEKTLAINSAINQYRSNGVFDNSSNTYWPVYVPTCVSPFFIDQMVIWMQTLVPNVFIGALDIKFMIGVFVIIIAGSVCCLLLALFERFIRQLLQMRKDKRDKYEYDNTVEQLTKF